MYIVCLHVTTPHTLLLKLALHCKKGKLPQSILTSEISYASSLLHTYYYSRGIWASLGQGLPFSDEKLFQVYFFGIFGTTYYQPQCILCSWWYL